MSSKAARHPGSHYAPLLLKMHARSGAVEGRPGLFPTPSRTLSLPPLVSTGGALGVGDALRDAGNPGRRLVQQSAQFGQPLLEPLDRHADQ